MSRPQTIVLVLAALFVLTGGAVPGAHAQLYVDTDATGGANDGSSWADAYTDLQTAIDNASSSDEVWVAEGVYTPDSEGDSFTITGASDGIEIYGGFAGTESSRSGRNPGTNPTVLSGDVNGNDTTTPDGVTETAAEISGANSNHVLHLDGTTGGSITDATVIDGVTVTAGQADGSADKNGGGLLCDGRGSDCSPTLRNVVFVGNFALDFGGAIYNDGRESGTSSPAIVNAVFTGNSTDRQGGAIYSNGFGGTASPVITSATFTGNSASDNGGAMYNNGPIGTVSPTVSNTILWGNAAGNAGGEIYNDDATPTLTHTIVEGGTGGIENAGGTTTFLDANDNSVSFSSSTNLDQNPQFDDASTPAGADGTYATVDDGVNLQDGSPALDAGSNDEVPSGLTEDIVGAPRVQDRDGDGTSTVNIGAYELISGTLPAAQTGSVQNVGVQSADLAGTVNPNGQQTSVTFKYRKTGGASFTSVTAAESPLNGVTDQLVSAGVEGLDPGTEYEVKVVATNAAGTSEGSLTTFTTDPEVPTAQTGSAQPVDILSASLAGTVNPGGQEADVTFEYRKTGAASFTSVPAAESPLNGVTDQPVSAGVEGLDPGTEYEFKVVATNATGTGEGSLTTFTTDPAEAPTVQTGAASNVGGTSADLGGTVNPGGLETTVQAQVFPTADPTNARQVTASASPLVAATTDQTVTVTLAGLQPDTEYEAHVFATNAEGGAEGSFVTFTTTSAGYVRTIEGQDGTGNDAGWRMLALPAAGKSRKALEGILNFSTSSGSILYRWTSGSWSAQTASSDDLPRGKGFMLYFFDDALDPIDSGGLPLAVPTGPEDQSTDHQVSGLSTGETFHLLGNPFDVAFDLSELNLSSQGFQQTVQIWDPSSQGYTQVTQGDADDAIGAWQGFLVERDPSADTDGMTLTFPTSGKQEGSGTIVGGQAAAIANTERKGEKRLRLDLRLAVLDTTESDASPPSPKADAAGPTRETPDSLAAATSLSASEGDAEADTVGTGRLGLLLSEEATGGWDAYEASQIGPPGGSAAAVTLSSPLELERSGDVRRALASEPYPGESAATVPVAVRADGVGGKGTIRLPEAQRQAISRQRSGWALRLTDTQAGEQVDLLKESYTFTVAPGEEDGSAGLQSPAESRFRLAVGPEESLPVTDGLTMKKPYPNPASGPVTVEYAVPREKADEAKLQLYDVLGRRVRTVSVKPGPRTRRFDVSGLASGVYVLRLTAEGAQQTRKLTVVR